MLNLLSETSTTHIERLKTEIIRLTVEKECAERVKDETKIELRQIQDKYNRCKAKLRQHNYNYVIRGNTLRDSPFMRSHSLESSVSQPSGKKEIFKYNTPTISIPTVVNGDIDSPQMSALSLGTQNAPITKSPFFRKKPT